MREYLADMTNRIFVLLNEAQDHPDEGEREVSLLLMAGLCCRTFRRVTHLSDQYSPFYTKVINTSVRDATHVLDGLLDHETDLEIEEHYVDTEGYTDQVFGMCHLEGFRFAPRIRDLKNRKVFTIEKPSRYGNLAPLIGGTVRVKQIGTHWEEVLRLASSVSTGTVTTASLILGKLAAYPRRNSLAWALKEIGKIERSLLYLDWLRSPGLRRRVNVGLNKGEARNALARAVFFNRLGEMRDRFYEDQTHRASGLNVRVRRSRGWRRWPAAAGGWRLASRRRSGRWAWPTTR